MTVVAVAVAAEVAVIVCHGGEGSEMGWLRRCGRRAPVHQSGTMKSLVKYIKKKKKK